MEIIETPVEVLPIIPAWTDQPAGPKAWCVSSRFQGQVLTMSFFQGQIPPSQVFQGQERVPRAETTALASLCNIIKYFRLLCKNLLLQATFMGWLHCLQKETTFSAQGESSDFWQGCEQSCPGWCHWWCSSFHPLLLDASDTGVVWPEKMSGCLKVTFSL